MLGHAAQYGGSQICAGKLVSADLRMPIGGPVPLPQEKCLLHPLHFVTAILELQLLQGPSPIQCSGELSQVPAAKSSWLARIVRVRKNEKRTA